MGFFNKKRKVIAYDKDSKRPVIKASICTGEQVAGFKDIHTGKKVATAWNAGKELMNK